METTERRALDIPAMERLEPIHTMDCSGSSERSDF